MKRNRTVLFGGSTSLGELPVRNEPARLMPVTMPMPMTKPATRNPAICLPNA